MSGRSPRDEAKIATIAKSLRLTPREVRVHLDDPGANRQPPRIAKAIAAAMRDDRGPRGRDATREHSTVLAGAGELEELTNDSLRAILNERGVAVRGRATKAELIKALQADTERT